MFTKTIIVSGISEELVLPYSFNGNVIYLLSGHGETALLEKFPDLHSALVFLSVPDWNRDMTPWASPRVFKGGEDFQGGADVFLKALVSSVLPEVEKCLPSPVRNRGLLGYSLSGLFSLYTLFQSDLFDRIACLSGSLWYPEFTAYVREHKVLNPQAKLLITLGDREKLTKNPVLSTVESCTEEIVSLLRSRGVSACYHLNPGGHGTQVEDRILEGIRFLSK